MQADRRVVAGRHVCIVQKGFRYEADDRFMGDLGEDVVPSKAGVTALFGGSCEIERENARDQKFCVCYA